MRILNYIPEDFSKELEDVFEMKSAIEDLCIVLADKNDLFKENSILYERLINDNKIYKKKLNLLFQKCIEDYNIDPNLQWFVNFNECYLFVKD